MSEFIKPIAQSWTGPISSIQNLEITNLRESRTRMKERSLEKKEHSVEKATDNQLSSFNLMITNWSTIRQTVQTPKRIQILNYPSIDETEETEQRLPQSLPYDLRKQKSSSKSSNKIVVKRTTTGHGVYDKYPREMTDSQPRVNSASTDKGIPPNQKIIQDNTSKVYNTIESRSIDIDLTKTFPRLASDQASNSQRNQLNHTYVPQFVSPNKFSEVVHQFMQKENYFESKNSPYKGKIKQARQAYGTVQSKPKTEVKRQPVQIQPQFTYNKATVKKIENKTQVDFNSKRHQIDQLELRQNEQKTVKQLLKLKEDTKALYKVFEKTTTDQQLLSKHLDMKLDQLYSKLVEKVRQDIKIHLSGQ